MKNLNEILKQEIRSTKQSYFARLTSQANDKTKWKIITSILNNNTKSFMTTSINEKDFLNYFSKTFSAKQNTISKEITKKFICKTAILRKCTTNEILHYFAQFKPKYTQQQNDLPMFVWRDIAENVV